MAKEELTLEEQRVAHEIGLRIERLKFGDELGTAEKVAADHGTDPDSVIKVMWNLMDDWLIARQNVTGIFVVGRGRKPFMLWNNTRRLLHLRKATQ